MKKHAVLILCLLLPVSPIVLADESAHFNHMIERLSAELSLSNDQKILIKQLFEEQKSKIIAIRNETQNKMHLILTPEQRKKLDKMRQQRLSQKGERHPKP